VRADYEELLKAHEGLVEEKILISNKLDRLQEIHYFNQKLISKLFGFSL